MNRSAIGAGRVLFSLLLFCLAGCEPFLLLSLIHISEPTRPY